MSKAMRNSARGETCTLQIAGYQHNPETTVAAHIGFGEGDGTAKRLRPGEANIVYACNECHDAIDGRRHDWDKEYKWYYIARALVRTFERRLARNI